MLIKRFEGPSLPAVIRQVRAELGPDAIVLSQRTRPAERGWLGMRGAQVCQVTAAVDRDHPVSPEQMGERTAPDATWRPLQLTRALIEPLEDEIRSLRCLLEEREPPVAAPSLAAEIEQLQALARSLGRAGASAGETPGLAPFLRAGLAPQHARSLAEDAALRVREGEAPDEARLSALAERLEQRLAAPRPDARRNQLVIGAPGVGKSTSLAKLADRCRDDRLTVLSADVHRPGASERLRAAAADLGVAFQELASTGGLARRSLRRRTLLVDTPGLVAHTPSALRDLRQLRAALGDRLEVQLVVSATTRLADLEQQLRTAAECSPTSLIVTRSDETRDLSNVANLLLEPGVPPLAWFGCGQRVPDDLALPDARALARGVLGLAA
jgi:flagellar biosynthesis protein FlhF